MARCPGPGVNAARSGPIADEVCLNDFKDQEMLPSETEA